jgi:hypothetical protein
VWTATLDVPVIPHVVATLHPSTKAVRIAARFSAFSFLVALSILDAISNVNGLVYEYITCVLEIETRTD